MGDNLWDSKEGHYDRPSSSVPRASETPKAQGSWLDPPESYRGVEPVHVGLDLASEPDVGALIEVHADAGELAAATAREAAIADAEGSGAAKARRDGRIDPESATALEQIAERALMLMARRDAINQDIRDLFGFAKDIGFNGPALRKTVKDLRDDPATRKLGELMHETYRAALGVEGPDFAIVLPKAALPVPPAEKRITAKEKNYRSTLALVAAGRIADAS